MAQYPWSSLPRFAAGGRPAWLAPSTALAEAGGLPDSPAGWRHYWTYLAFLADDPQARKELCAAKLSRGWCVGSPSFKEEIRREHALHGAKIERFSGLEPDEMRLERERHWQEHLQRLAAVAGIDLEHLPLRKSAPQKSLLAAALKASTSVSNRWLADSLELGHVSSVSQIIGRFRRLENAKLQLQGLLSQVLT